MRSTRLNDEAVFKRVSGLWKSDRDPRLNACVIRGTNIRGDGLLDFSNVVELDVEARYLNERRLEDEDIIIERSGGGPKQPVGRVASFVQPDTRTYFTSNFTTAIRVIDRTRFDPRYVALYLNSLYLAGATASLQRATTGIRNLDWQEYLQFQIPEIELATQQSVVRLVEGVRSLMLAEERQIEIASAIKRAMLNLAFTQGLRGEPQKETEIGLIPESWELGRLGNYIDPPDYGFTAKASNEPIGPQFLRITDIQDGQVDWCKVPYCPCDERSLESKRLRKGDVVVARIGATTGKAFLVGDCPDAVFASYLIRLRAREQSLAAQFLYFFMQSDAYWLHIQQHKGGRLKGGVNIPILAGLLIPRPSIDEQFEIATLLDTIDCKIDLHRRKSAILEGIFKALLHNLMTGELLAADLDLPALSPNEPEPAAA